MFSDMPDVEVTADIGVAVFELFTSEGCSSCSPAEQLLEPLQNESAGKPIYVLAYHVDYWDRFGWKEAFSSHFFQNVNMITVVVSVASLYTATNHKQC